MSISVLVTFEVLALKLVTLKSWRITLLPHNVGLYLRLRTQSHATIAINFTVESGLSIDDFVMIAPYSRQQGVLGHE